jgi:hypothetical protein
MLQSALTNANIWLYQLNYADHLIVFFNYVKLQIVKRNIFYKAISCESGLAGSLEIRDGRLKPDRFLKVELDAGLLEGVIDLVGAGVGRVVFDG